MISIAMSPSWTVRVDAMLSANAGYIKAKTQILEENSPRWKIDGPRDPASIERDLCAILIEPRLNREVGFEIDDVPNHRTTSAFGECEVRDTFY